MEQAHQNISENIQLNVTESEAQKAVPLAGESGRSKVLKKYLNLLNSLINIYY